MNWYKAVSLESLEASHAHCLKNGSKQIAIFKIGENIFALDNRCPHQGYPLVDGALSTDATITCNWHNWKFDLTSGHCLTGGDSVRIFPTKIEDGFVWVDMAEKSKAEMTTDILFSLKVAFDKNKYGRISRDLAKLYFNGIDPLIAFKEVILWVSDRSKIGTTQAIAALSDWIELYLHHNGNFENQLICLMEGVDHVSREFLSVKNISVGVEAKKFSREAFLNAVEKEDAIEAKKLIQGALNDGYRFSTLESLFLTAALLHFTNNGEHLIYVLRTGKLIDALGETVEKPLLCLLTEALCRGTREDLLPEFTVHQKYVEKFSKKGSPEKRFQDLLHDIGKLALTFNIDYQLSFDKPVNYNVDYQEIIQGIIFAHAVHELCKKHPQFWEKALIQLGAFCSGYERFCDSTLKYSRSNESDIQDKILDHGLASQDEVIYRLQSFIAVTSLVKVMPVSIQKILWSALNRFIHAPVKEKHTRRKARQNIQLVSLDFK